MTGKRVVRQLERVRAFVPIRVLIGVTSLLSGAASAKALLADEVPVPPARATAPAPAPPPALVQLPDTTQRVVTGVVVERGNGLPVPGAMVLLFDGGGAQVDRFLTNAAGRFMLDVAEPGPHFITVERIGYANLTTDRFEPGPDDPVMVIDVPVEPVSLRGLAVEAGPRCEVRPEEGRATARVWDEVRKALAAEAWTREAALYTYMLQRFERTLDRDAESVTSTAEPLTEARDAAFYSAEIETLADQGFVQAEGDTATVYYAPDADALLSDPFLDTHCFGVTAPMNGQIGLTFEPVGGRTVPEIHGVLWVDETTAELDRMVYRYVNLIRSSEIGEPGGEVYFTRLPDGAWIVRLWRIRMPVLDENRRGRIRRTGYREEGGFTEAITDTRGRRVLDAGAASIFGVVADSVGTESPDMPIGVERVGTRDFAVTDPDGTFLFTRLPSGRHLLRVITPVLERWRIAAPETVVDGRIGEVSYARIRLPSMADALAHSCGAASGTYTAASGADATATLLGRITDADGLVRAGVRVRIAWPAATGFAPAPIAAPRRPDGDPVPAWELGRDGYFATAATITDDRGLFMVCGVPHGSRLRVAVGLPGSDDPLTQATLFVPSGAGAVVETLTVP